MNVVYTSSDGKSYPLTVDMSMRLKTANFHSYSWKPEVTARRIGERVDTWKKDAQKYPATIIFRGTHAHRKARLDEFHSSIERDVFYNSPGRITWGEWYAYCFINFSSTYPSESDLVSTVNEVEIYCPSSLWISEQSIGIASAEDIELLETDKQYNLTYGYPYSYMTVYNATKQIYIDHYAPCDFRAVLYGPQDNFNVTIGNVHLLVNYAIPAGGYMVVDTRESIPANKHCYLMTASGEEINCFNYRNPTTALLEKVEPGNVSVTYNRHSNLNLTIYRERSEPAWI